MTTKMTSINPVFEDNPMAKKRLIFHEGSSYFRQRLVLSLLSSKPVSLKEIRSKSDIAVGLTPYEISFLRLLEALSNGFKGKISETGTEVRVIPGVLTGGTINFNCDEGRPLSYYLEPILLLAPFCKKPLNLTLKGRIQNDSAGYNSIYKIKYSALPLMEHFGLEPDIQVISRSYAESEIKFTCNVKKQLLTLRTQLNQDCGKVKKVRGLSYGFRISPQMLNRMITSAKGVFVPYLSDVFVTNDQVKGSKSKTPGFGIVMHALTTKGISYSADGFIGRDEEGKGLTTVVSQNLSGQSKKRKFELFPDDENPNPEEGLIKKARRLKQEQDDKSAEMKTKAGTLTSPEELGAYVAKVLLREISTQSCVDSVFQWLVLGYMALGPKDITSVRLGSLTPFTVQYLRDLRTFFGVTFKIEKHTNVEDDLESENDADNNGLLKLSCVGTGYMNFNKTMV